MVTYDESMSIHFDGDDVRAVHYPNGHTDGDSVIFFTSISGAGFGLMAWMGWLALVAIKPLLAAVSSAQGERSEWQLMFAQPVPRITYALAKFIAYLSIFALVLLLLFVPAAIASARVQTIVLLYLQTWLLAATFLALGLAIGPALGGLVIAVQGHASLAYALRLSPTVTGSLTLAAVLRRHE